MIYGDPNNPYICWVEGKPYSTDEKQKTGDLCVFMYLDTSFLHRDSEEGRLGITLDKIKLEVAHRTAGRIAAMYADGRQYQIINEPVKHVTVGVYASVSTGGIGGYRSSQNNIIVYQTIRSILLDPFTAEIGDYSYPGGRYFNNYGTEAVLNKKTNEIVYFAPAYALSYGIIQRVASMGNGATVQPGDIEIEDTKLVVDRTAIELEG